MIFNGMSAVCALAGVVVGMEIMWLLTKHRHDQLVNRIDRLDDDLAKAFVENARLRDNWGRSIELAWKVVGYNKELIEQRKGKK